MRVPGPLKSPGRWAVRAGGVCFCHPDSELQYPHGSTVRDRIDPELIRGIGGRQDCKAVFCGRLTGVGVVGEIPQGESWDEQDEQEQALGMLAFNSPGEETGQEGSREQAAREVSEVRGESGGTRGLPQAHPEHCQNIFQAHV